MSKRGRVARLLGAFVFIAAVVGSAGRCEAFVPVITDEDRAIVQGVLDQEKPADQVTSELVELLVSERWGVREVAAQELMQRDLAERDLNRLETIVGPPPPDPSGSMASQAWPVLARGRTEGKSLDEQIEWCVTQLRYPLGLWRASGAVGHLVEIGDRAVPRLIRATEREGTYAQEMAAAALMRIGTQDATTAVERWALRALETTDDPLLLQGATYNLGKLRSEAGFEPLERGLWDHLEEHWSWAIIDSLVQIDPERARELLLRILAEHEPEAGRPGLIEPYLRSARHLATLGEERGWMALEDAVHSPLPDVRRELASALSATWNPRARESLVTLTQDENEQVAESATYWLNNFDQGLKRMEERQ